MRTDFCIVCTTCNAYSDLWENNKKEIDRYWVGHPAIYYVSDKSCMRVKTDGVNVLKYEGNYSDRLKSALLDIKENYVFLTMDDYLLCHDADTKAIEYLLDLMEKDGVSYIKTYRAPYGEYIDKERKIKNLPLNEPYEVSLTPGLWRREDLISVLGNNETPWQAEVKFTARCKERGYTCYCCSNEEIFKYVDVIRKGKYLVDARKYLVRNGLYVSDRETMSIGDRVSLFVKTIGSAILPYNLRKKVVRLFNIKSFSCKE